MKDIVEIYKECGDFSKAVQLSGLPHLVAHIKLLNSGVLKIQDKINYGSNAAKMGGKAEALFQKLVPEAIDANKYWKKNNPVFDFNYKEMTVDVKYSSLHKEGDWSFRSSTDPDFLCVFLDNGKELEDYFILLIPNAFLNQKDTVHVSKSGAWFNNFQVSKEELKGILDMYVETLNMSKERTD